MKMARDPACAGSAQDHAHGPGGAPEGGAEGREAGAARMSAARRRKRASAAGAAARAKQGGLHSDCSPRVPSGRAAQAAQGRRAACVLPLRAARVPREAFSRLVRTLRGRHALVTHSHAGARQGDRAVLDSLKANHKADDTVPKGDGVPRAPVRRRQGRRKVAVSWGSCGDRLTDSCRVSRRRRRARQWSSPRRHHDSFRRPESARRAETSFQGERGQGGG